MTQKSEMISKNEATVNLPEQFNRENMEFADDLIKYLQNKNPSVEIKPREDTAKTHTAKCEYEIWYKGKHVGDLTARGKPQKPAQYGYYINQAYFTDEVKTQEENLVITDNDNEILKTAILQSFKIIDDKNKETAKNKETKDTKESKQPKNKD